MGRVYKVRRRRRDGTAFMSKKWWVDYFDASGDRIRRPASTDKKIAERMLREAETEAEQIRNGAPSRGSLDINLKDLANQFLEAMELHLKPRTLQDYREVLHRLILGNKPGIKVKKASQLKPSTIQHYQVKASKKLTPRTINKHVTVLGTMLNWAVQYQLIPHNPIRGVRKLPHGATRTQRALSEEEISELLLAADDESRPVWIFFLETGMRKGEVARLTWSDLDFDASIIRVRAEVTKTHKGRSIPMSARVKRLLEKRFESEDPKKSDPVFATIRGRPFYTQSLAIFHHDVEAANIDPEGVHIHGLRRTFATRLIKAGADPKTVQTLLGHSTLNLTLQLYTDGNAMDLKGAIDELPDLKVEEAMPWYGAVCELPEPYQNAG